MKDRRVQVFRSAVDALIESLEAVIRLSRWTNDEAAPEPLVTSAGLVVERLGVADRLAASRFDGPQPDAGRVAAMCAAMKRLDVAYRAFRRDAEASPEAARDAAAALEVEIAATSAGAGAWQ